MEPANFEQSNITMDTPEGVSVQDVFPVSAFIGEVCGQRMTVTCWKVTKDELEQLQKNGGRVWLKIMGYGMPPVALTTKCPWETEEPTATITVEPIE